MGEPCEELGRQGMSLHYAHPEHTGHFSPTLHSSGVPGHAESPVCVMPRVCASAAPRSPCQDMHPV